MKRYCTLKIRLEGLQERTCCYALWRCHQLRRTSTPPIANAQNATPPPLGDWSHRQLCGASAEHTKTLHKLLIIVHFDDVTNNNLFSTHCQWSSCNTSTSWLFSSSAEQTIQLLINSWLLYTLTKPPTTISSPPNSNVHHGKIPPLGDSAHPRLCGASVQQTIQLNNTDCRLLYTETISPISISSPLIENFWLATPSPLWDTTYRQLHGTSPEHTLQLLISDHRTSNLPLLNPYQTVRRLCPRPV